ncbi:unnamed protein product [Withania somnifera]
MYIKDSGNSAKEKEKNKDRSVFSTKMDGQEVRVEPRIGANAIRSSFPGMAKSKFHGLLPPLEETVENRREEKEKSKERRNDKPRDKKKSKEKDAKRREGEGKSAHKKSEHDKLREINKSNFVGVSSINHQVPLVLKDTIAGATEGNHRKRKDIEANGFLHENELRPAKLPRPSSSHLPTLNGKRLETHQKANILSSNKQGVATDFQVINKEQSLNGSIKLSNKHGAYTDIVVGNMETHQKSDMLSSNKQGVVTDIQVINKELNGAIKLSNKHRVATDIEMGNKERGINGTSKLPNNPGVPIDIEVGNKEHGVNGTIKGQPLTMSKPKTLSVSKSSASSMSLGADQIAEASKRPPHPDSKYLNQILSVPKMDEWSEFDDQEWLFGSKSTHIRNPDMCLDEVKNHRVWSEALQIDSADVCALPYVIPF